MPMFMFNGKNFTYEWQGEDGAAIDFKGAFITFGGSSTSPASLLYTEKALNVYTTTPSTNASTSFEPVLFYTTLTGAGQVGGRVRAFMTTNVALGGWSNAFKGEVTYGAAGRTNGIGSSIVAEMTLSAGTTQGNYAPLEVELNIPSGAQVGTQTALAFFSANGADVATYRTSGVLFTINGMGTASATQNIFHTTGTVSATHGLRIKIDGVAYDILLKASTYA